MTTDLYWTISTLVLCRATGIPPLEIRRQQVVLKYTEKIRSYPEYPLNSQINRPDYKDVYRYLPRVQDPLEPSGRNNLVSRLRATQISRNKASEDYVGTPISPTATYYWEGEGQIAENGVSQFWFNIYWKNSCHYAV